MTCSACHGTGMRAYGSLGVVGIFDDCDQCTTAAADWHPEYVKAAIRAKGVRLSEFAARLGCEASTVAKAIRSPMSRRLDQAIARFLGVPAAEIWPSRYPALGNLPTTTRMRGAA